MIIRGMAMGRKKQKTIMLRAIANKKKILGNSGPIFLIQGVQEWLDLGIEIGSAGLGSPVAFCFSPLLSTGWFLSQVGFFSAGCP